MTVIASFRIHTPRGAGSRMLVDKEGLVCGTIGGGAVEYKAHGHCEGGPGEKVLLYPMDSHADPAIRWRTSAWSAAGM